MKFQYIYIRGNYHLYEDVNTLNKKYISCFQICCLTTSNSRYVYIGEEYITNKWYLQQIQKWLLVSVYMVSKWIFLETQKIVLLVLSEPGRHETAHESYISYPGDIERAGPYFLQITDDHFYRQLWYVQNADYIFITLTDIVLLVHEVSNELIEILLIDTK